MPDHATCSTCGYALISGQEECPNCGAIVPLQLVDDLHPSPREPVTNKTKRETVHGKQPVALFLRPFQDILQEARQYEQAGNLTAALDAYRLALVFAETNQKADPSLELVVQTLSLLIQRTEHLLAKQTAPRNLAEPTLPENEKEEVLARKSKDIPSVFSDTTPPLPPPPSPKFDRTTKRVLIFGCIVSLGLFILVIGLTIIVRHGSNVPLFATHTPINTPTPTWGVNIFDSFDSDENNWPTKVFLDSCGREIMQIQNGKLVWNLKNSKDCYYWEISETGAFTDFNYSIDVQQITGLAESNYGIIFRDQGDSGQYFFDITNDYQEYAFFLYQQDSWTTLIDWTSSPSIRPGDVNRIGVVAQDSVFQFYINGTMVATFSDDTLSSGAVGVAADPGSSGTELILEYDNFELHGNP